VTLQWTAPGDDGVSGVCQSYHLVYSTSPILSDEDFDNATEFAGAPTPSSAGTVQSVAVTGLSPNTTYYFAIKGDDGWNYGDLSNVPSGTTQP
jgi:phosphodiesterase/alkaline phosphatase D-like protein